MHTKHQRAYSIVNAVDFLDGQTGSNIPPRLRDASKPGRRIEQGRLIMTRQIDTRMVYARQSPQTVAEMLMHVPGCEMTEILVHGERALIVNRYEGRIEIYFFKPGDWETDFGVDHGGDTVPIIPGYFADPRCKDWQAFLRSPEGEWPPRCGTFGLPIHDDDDEPVPA